MRFKSAYYMWAIQFARSPKMSSGDWAIKNLEKTGEFITRIPYLVRFIRLNRISALVLAR